MSDKWGSVIDLLNLRDRRKESQRDRIFGSVGNIASMLYGRKEREAGEEFTAGESELDRESRADLAEAQREHTGVLQELVGEQALEQITTGAEEGRITQAEGAGQASDLAEKNNQARADLQATIGDQALAQIDARLEADLDVLEQQWAQRSAEYDEEQSYYSATTGKMYRWSTQEEFDIIKAQLESDNYIEAQRLIADLRDVDPDAQSRIIGAYTFAKNEVLNPSVLDPATGAWRSMAEITPEALREQFMAAVALHDLSEEEAERAFRLFQGFIETIPDAAPDADVEPTRPGLTNIPLGEGTVASDVQELGFLGRATAPLVALGEKLFPNLYPQTQEAEGEQALDTPQAVDTVEKPFYDQLMALTENPEVGSDAQALGTRIETETIGQDELQQLLDEILSRLGPQEPRRLDYRPQSASPQGDQLSYVRNMLRGV